jgi:DNA (cytosine-5)-methyltransferase 1
MKHGSLFSGIGGFDLASEWMGWENVFHCEIAEFPRKVLNYYWPNAKTHEDITKTDFTIYRGTIDILTGGFPCQPYSAAGKRLGKEDSRHLWPQMLRAIQEIKPRWIVGENVAGFLTWNDGLVFREVCTDLENEGYEVQAFIIPACAVGAPHRRDRVWIVANAIGKRNTSCESSSEFKTIGCKNNGKPKKWFKQTERFNGLDGFQRTTTNTNNTPTEYPIQTREHMFTSEINSRFTTNAASIGLERERWSIGKLDRKFRFSRSSSRNMQCTSWQNFPTKSPICSGNDGISDKLDRITFPKWRNESIKGYGNAVVPQVVHKIFQAIQHIEQ